MDCRCPEKQGQMMPVLNDGCQGVNTVTHVGPATDQIDGIEGMQMSLMTTETHPAQEQ